ncbi:MAG: MFS transporter [Gaiellaceae bacterium]
MASAESLVQRPLPPLRRQSAFLRLWASVSVSVFGDQISALAIPLAAVLMLHASATEMGLLTALFWLPHLVFALPVGVWVDARRVKRRVMIVADVGRAALLASIPLAAAFDALSLEQLYVVVFLVGSCAVFFDLSYSSFFTATVPREQVLAANGRLSTSRAVAYVAGPSLAGVLVQVLTAPLAILADAVSFVASALFLRGARVDEPFHESGGVSALLRTKEGIRILMHHPLLRGSVGCASTVNFFTFMIAAVYVLYASSTLDLSAGVIGITLGVGAGGALLGALVAPRIGRRIGLGPTIVLGCLLFSAPLVVLPFASGSTLEKAVILCAVELVSGFGVMLFDTNSNSMTALAVPQRLRARIAGASRVFNYGTRPFGALVGGMLAGAIGIRPMLLLAAIGAVSSVIWLLASPIAGTRELAAELDL